MTSRDDVYFVDNPPEDVLRCTECEAIIACGNVCERCETGYFEWLMNQEPSAFAADHIPDSDASHHARLSGYLPDTSGPEGTPF